MAVSNALYRVSEYLECTIRAWFVNQGISIDSGEKAWNTGRVHINSFRKPLAECSPNELWKAELDIELTQRDTLAEQRKIGVIGIKTSNYYLVSIKEFCNWAVADGLVSENPLRGAKPMNSDGDVRRKRRAISSEEIERFILAAMTWESIQSVMPDPVQGPEFGRIRTQNPQNHAV